MSFETFTFIGRIARLVGRQEVQLVLCNENETTQLLPGVSVSNHLILGNELQVSMHDTAPINKWDRMFRTVFMITTTDLPCQDFEVVFGKLEPLTPRAYACPATVEYKSVVVVQTLETTFREELTVRLHLEQQSGYIEFLQSKGLEKLGLGPAFDISTIEIMTNRQNVIILQPKEPRKESFKIWVEHPPLESIAKRVDTADSKLGFTSLPHGLLHTAFTSEKAVHLIHEEQRITKPSILR